MTTHPVPRDDPPGQRGGPARRLRRPFTRAALACACLAGVSVLTLAAPGPAGASTRTTAADPTAYVVAVSGNVQTTTTRSPFDQPLRVLVYDDSGHEIVGTTVTFRIHTGGAFTGTASFPGGAQSADVTTGADGGATSPMLTAGADVGYLQVTATVPRMARGETFVLTVGYSPAARVNLISGDGQSAVAGTDLAHPYVVQVLDAHGYPVLDGSKVTFHAEPTGPHPGTATFPGGQTTATVGISAGNGYATSPTLTAGRVPGTFTVTATVWQSPNVPQAAFTGTTLPQASTTIEVLSGNYQFSSESRLFPAQLQARILDQAGNPVRLPSGHISVTGPAALYGRTSVEFQGTAEGVIPMPVAATSGTGPVQVTVTSGTAAPAVFHEYVVPGRGAVTISALRGGNQETSPGQPFRDRLGVLVQDGDARVIPDFPVTFAVGGPAAFAGGSKAAVVMSSPSDITYAPPLSATSTVGPVTVTVTVAGSNASAVFHLQVGHVNGLNILGGDQQTATQSAPSGSLTAFAAPLTVLAIQSNGKPGNGVRVTYHVNNVAFFAGALFETSGLTGPDGQFSAMLYTRRDLIGAVTVTASAPGYGSVTFTETVVSR